MAWFKPREGIKKPGFFPGLLIIVFFEYYQSLGGYFPWLTSLVIFSIVVGRSS